MKSLNFRPHKSKTAFKRNYELHDIAEWNGCNLLTQWGFSFAPFGSDARNESVWEKGEDKPDQIITYKNRSALLDWKSKKKRKWLVNKRAVDSYLKWSEKMNLPVIIAFFVFDDNKRILERRFAMLNKQKYRLSKNKQWDKNETYEFDDTIPLFDRNNLIKLLLSS